MPNIIITRKCNKNCVYCFAQSNGQESLNFFVKNEISLVNFKYVLDFLERSGEHKVRLMGGEPTLHKKFKNIIMIALDRARDIHLFTNGLFGNKMLNFLSKQGKKITYSFNVDFPGAYSQGDWTRLNSNIKRLSNQADCLLGGVVYDNNFKIDHLIDLMKKYKMKSAIMVRPANPTINNRNVYIKKDKLKLMAKNLINEVIKADKNNIKIGFGCGLDKKIFTANQIKVLTSKKVIYLKWGCLGNSGKFDIAPDLSVFRCFPLSGRSKKFLFNFKNCDEVIEYFDRTEIKKKNFCLARFFEK